MSKKERIEGHTEIAGKVLHHEWGRTVCGEYVIIDDDIHPLSAISYCLIPFSLSSNLRIVLNYFLVIHDHEWDFNYLDESSGGDESMATNKWFITKIRSGRRISD